MSICPVCNGLIDYVAYCEWCGGRMEIEDRVENYYDDYTPYLSYELTDLNDGDSSQICRHICFCRNCSSQGVVAIRNIVK